MATAEATGGASERCQRRRMSPALHSPAATHRTEGRRQRPARGTLAVGTLGAWHTDAGMQRAVRGQRAQPSKRTGCPHLGTVTCVEYLCRRNRSSKREGSRTQSLGGTKLSHTRPTHPPNMVAPNTLSPGFRSVTPEATLAAHRVSTGVSATRSASATAFVVEPSIPHA